MEHEVSQLIVGSLVTLFLAPASFVIPLWWIKRWIFDN